MTTLWPWLAIAGLGAFHGLNPAMGWLFAVALGLHRGSRAVVGWSLLPIVTGHAAAVAAIVAVFLVLGAVIESHYMTRAAGVVLIGWAAYHGLYGHRRRVRFGMQVGMAGLTAWSFLMAMAHGAGLMLIPALAPLSLVHGSHHGLPAGGSVLLAIAAVSLHAATMLAATAGAAFLVYDWVGLGVLRQGWVNVDAVWTAALALCGAILLLI